MSQIGGDINGGRKNETDIGHRMYGVEEGPRKGEEDMKRTRAKRQTRKKNRKKRGVRLYTPVKLQV